MIVRIALSEKSTRTPATSGDSRQNAAVTGRALSLDLLGRVVKERLHGCVLQEADGARLELRVPKASFTLQETAALPVLGASRQAAAISGEA